MKVWFNPGKAIESTLSEIAVQTEGFDLAFVPNVRPADPRFGDFQANGVLAFAKQQKLNPRELASCLIDAANESGAFDPALGRSDLTRPTKKLRAQTA